MKGKLNIYRTHVKTGKKELVESISNMIVNQMYNVLLNLFNADPTYHVATMKFGTGTSSTAVDWTTLQLPITPAKDVNAAISPTDDFAVVFTAALGAGEGNGFAISEAGLFTQAGLMVARTVFTARTKTSSYNFGFEWTVDVKAS